nr:hypothetical protein GCM10020093_050120 [Planobispora longispora]
MPLGLENSAELENQVTPLIEPAATPGRHRVTFLWRARNEDEKAVVLINTLTDRDRHAGDISAHVMRRTPGDDVLRLTYELEADLRASYQILPCTEVPGTDRDSWLRVMTTALPDPGNPVRVPGSHGRNPPPCWSCPARPRSRTGTGGPASPRAGSARARSRGGGSGSTRRPGTTPATAPGTAPETALPGRTR